MSQLDQAHARRLIARLPGTTPTTPPQPEATRATVEPQGWREILKRAREGVASGSRSGTDIECSLAYCVPLLEHLAEEFEALEAAPATRGGEAERKAKAEAYWAAYKDGMQSIYSRWDFALRANLPFAHYVTDDEELERRYLKTQELRAELSAAQADSKFLLASTAELQREVTALKAASALAARRVVELEADATNYQWLRNFRNFALVDALLNKAQFNTLDAAVAAVKAQEPLRCDGCDGTIAEHDKLLRCLQPNAAGTSGTGLER